MIARRTLSWAAALMIALLMSVSHLLDGPDDIQTQQLIADDLEQAVQTAGVRP